MSASICNPDRSFADIASALPKTMLLQNVALLGALLFWIGSSPSRLIRSKYD